jgi:signal transduction histidine kinase
MTDSNSTVSRWQDWTVLVLRIIFIAITFGVIVLWRSNGIETANPLTGMTIPAIVAVGMILSLLLVNLIKSLQDAVPFVLTVGDWLLTGSFLYAVDAEPILAIPIATTLIVTGLLYLGPLWGGFQSTGVLAATAGLAIYLADNSDLAGVMDTYELSFAIILAAGISTLIWVIVRDRYEVSDRYALRQMATKREDQLKDMQDRSIALAEMTDAITGTLDHSKILQSALNTGLVTLRKHKDHRAVSVVLLFREDDRLYIADQVGLSNIDIHQSFSSEQGIVAECLEEAVPRTTGTPMKDQLLTELGLKAMRSVLVLPLRAHYDNYGVLIYASEMADAFTKDHIHALNTIVRQATVALQNAVLYDSLLADKRRIIQMEEDARKALVRDLHDVPTQTVSAIKMRLSIAKRMIETGKGNIASELTEIEDMAQRASEELRHVLFKLRPLALESQGLSAALEQLKEKLKQTFQQNLVVKIAPDFERYLDEQQKGALFYLIEEAVNNARKYAEASTIGIQAGRQNNMLVVRIIDNGKGFDAEAVNNGYDQRGSFGMVNMRERAELLDGSLQLKSAPGQGTQITVFIPLKQQKQSPRGERNGVPASPIAATKLATSARGAIERMRYD